MTDDADLTLHEPGLGYLRVDTEENPVGLKIATNPHRWHPSAADEHDMGNDCGEDDCERCNG